MNTKELRIGSYYAIDGIIRRLMYDDMRDALINEVRVTPIPLNEEWMLKFGFKAKNGYWHYGDNPLTKDFLLRISQNGDIFYYDNMYFRMKYVHQLQNLFYGLVQKEFEE